MFSVQIDEQSFFTGSYVKVGSIKNGVNVNKLPPPENSLCYKLVDVEVPVQYEEPVLQYLVHTVSDTEFDINYVLISVDEEGNEVQTFITEEEYDILTDEEKENVIITQVPKYITTELTKEEYNSLTDDEKSNVVVSYKIDEEGNIIYETVTTIEIVKDWEFSQERYDELEAKRIADEEQQKADEEYQKSISNETLANRIIVLEESVATSDAMSEAILEGVNEV